MLIFVFIRFKVTEENVYSVLCFADVYLLSGLKRLCARVITTFLDPENVLTVLRTARLFNQPRLEVDCCEYISKHLEKVRKTTRIERLCNSPGQTRTRVAERWLSRVSFLQLSVIDYYHHLILVWPGRVACLRYDVAWSSGLVRWN